MSNRPRPQGRESRLADPAFLRLVAEGFAAGLSRQAMCDELGLKDKDTITKYRRDPRVKALVTKLIEDRAIQISRKIDSVIEGRLAHAEDMKVETLLAIRKEYGGAMVSRKEIADDAVTADALKAMESDPDFQTKLEDLLTGSEAQADEVEA